MKDHFKVRLVARNEAIEYFDKNGVYRFEVSLLGNRWVGYLPGSKGDDFMVHELSEDEGRVVLPRIRSFLESRRYFLIFGKTFPVVFERKEPLWQPRH